MILQFMGIILAILGIWQGMQVLVWLFAQLMNFVDYCKVFQKDYMLRQINDNERRWNDALYTMRSELKRHDLLKVFYEGLHYRNARDDMNQND